MTPARLLPAAAALLVTLVTFAAVPPAGAATYPVVYNISAARGVLADHTAPPPGANDFSCKPSAAHPNPVVLVHGLGATMGENWATFSPLLADNGYCVFALTYGTHSGEDFVGGLQAMEQSSAELAGFVDRVLAATGAEKVDLVGHSEGTVMPQYYLKFRGGAAKVDKYVAISPLYHGTTLLGLGTFITAFKTAFPTLAGPISEQFARGCGSCLEFLRGSAFLRHLYADGHYAVPGVTYTAIMTKYDELVTPYTSGRLPAGPNVTNIVVQNQCAKDFAEHVAVAFDPTVGQDVLNALDPAHPRPVPCRLVLPGIGAPLG
jgi:pimeloyl-ACP methyl ester carboxylesterase